MFVVTKIQRFPRSWERSGPPNEYISFFVERLFKVLFKKEVVFVSEKESKKVSGLC